MDPDLETTEEPKSDGLLRLFAADAPAEGDEPEFSVEEGDEGLAEAGLSLEDGSKGEDETSADDEGADDESEPGDRAQKRIEALVGARNAEREAKVELQTKLVDANKVIEDLRGDMTAIEAKPPEWFETLYGNFEDPVGTARFDAALCGVLDEPAFRDDPSVKKVIDRAMAELKKRGFTMTQDAKPQVPKAVKVETPAPVAEDWTARSLVESSVQAVLKRAGVRPELVPVLTDAVSPELVKQSATAKAMPNEKAIVDAISARVKALGWKPDFYRAPKEDSKQDARPGTGGARAAVVTPKKASAKSDPKTDAKVEAPKTAEEADALRSSKIRTLIEQLPAEQRGAVA